MGQPWALTAEVTCIQTQQEPEQWLQETVVPQGPAPKLDRAKGTGLTHRHQGHPRGPNFQAPGHPLPSSQVHASHHHQDPYHHRSPCLLRDSTPTQINSCCSLQGTYSKSIKPQSQRPPGPLSFVACWVLGGFVPFIPVRNIS